MQLIISNGHGLFPLRIAAAEACRSGIAAAFVTGAYPTPWLKRVLTGTGLAGRPPLRRLLEREAAIAPEQVHAMWLSEPFARLGSLLARLPAGQRLGDRTTRLARVLYARRAGTVVRRLSGDGAGGIYHYRSGYGGCSVAAARARGMIALCDHSIAHPGVLDYLVEHDGRLPPPGRSGTVHGSWRAVADDLAQADHVLVNADFVRDTFVHQGWDTARIHVLYAGVDQRFLEALPERSAPASGPLRLLFAGAFSRRKGAPDVAVALAGLTDVDWRLEICGDVEPALAGPLAGFLRDPRVILSGTVPRDRLAARMTAAEILVFPTRAEGSARVVFEALAAGCFVITTANAGSIVGRGAVGGQIPPGDPEALRTALREAADGRVGLAASGRANAALIRRTYREADFGAGLISLYGALMAGLPGHQALT